MACSAQLLTSPTLRVYLPAPEPTRPQQPWHGMVPCRRRHRVARINLFLHCASCARTYLGHNHHAGHSQDCQGHGLQAGRAARRHRWRRPVSPRAARLFSAGSQDAACLCWPRLEEQGRNHGVSSRMALKYCRIRFSTNVRWGWLDSKFSMLRRFSSNAQQKVVCILSLD
eukprot:1175933-Pleurochrysis_carterae.AAC.2